MTVEQLARLLSEEFARENWGAIEPHLFGLVASGADNEDRDAPFLREVLARVVDRMNG